MCLNIGNKGVLQEKKKLYNVAHKPYWFLTLTQLFSRFEGFYDLPEKFVCIFSRPSIWKESAEFTPKLELMLLFPQKELSKIWCYNSFVFFVPGRELHGTCNCNDNAFDHFPHVNDGNLKEIIPFGTGSDSWRFHLDIVS